jgi:hypothetical protein
MRKSRVKRERNQRGKKENEKLKREKSQRKRKIQTYRR